MDQWLAGQCPADPCADAHDDHEDEVELEDAPDNSYTLMVCGVERGVMEVVGGEGELEFRSPESDGKPILNFDPTDCDPGTLDGHGVIELLDVTGVAFTSGEDLLE